MSLVKQISIYTKNEDDTSSWEIKDIGVNLNNVNCSSNYIESDNNSVIYTDNDYLLYIKNNKIQKSNINLKQLQEAIAYYQSQQSEQGEPEL